MLKIILIVFSVAARGVLFTRGFCVDPGFPDNSARQPSYVYNNFNDGDQVTFTCNSPGYSLYAGSLTTYCQGDGSWSNQLPNCSLIDCGDPGFVLFGNRSILGTTYGSNVTYFCDTTMYEFAPPVDPPSTPSVTLTCQDNKQWSGQLPLCQRKSCGDPPSINGAFITKTGIQAGDTAIYAATVGYRLSGQVTLTCMNNKNWEPAGQPISTIVTCQLPALSQNTIWSSNTSILASFYSGSLPYSSRIEAKCSLGFYYGSGSETRSCQDDGTWSGSPLICKPITCGSLTISGAIVDQPSNEVGSNSTASCRPGFYYSGTGDVVRTCLQSGTWSGSDIICDAVPCSDLNFTMSENASVSVVTSNFTAPTRITLWKISSSVYISSARYGDKVSFSCLNGTKWARGSRTLTCQNDGTWTSVTPIVCKVSIPLPGIGQDFPKTRVEAQNADYVGKVIVVALFSGLAAIAVIDILAMMRHFVKRFKELFDQQNTVEPETPGEKFGHRD